jgi:methionyl-tRNA formyltransferase
MKILYVSRQFNRSGYEILEYLINHTTFKPDAILLPFDNANLKLDDEIHSVEEINKYMQEADYYDCKPLRFLKSIKLLADNVGIRVIQKESIKTDETYQLIKEMSFDLIVLGGGWPELLPKRVIRLPKLGVINAHPSLLPEFRGTDIHRWQVLMNVQTSGVTIHYVDETFDTGEILGQVSTQVSSQDTPQELFAKVAGISGPLMNTVLDKIQVKMPEKVKGAPQAERNAKSKYFSAWKWDDKEFQFINWRKSAYELWRLVLASTQESYKYNGPYFNVKGHVYILRQAEVVNWELAALCGDILDCQGYMAIKCGNSNFALKLLQVQPINKDDWNGCNHMAAAISGKEFLLCENMSVGDNILSFEVKGGTK